MRSHLESFQPTKPLSDSDLLQLTANIVSAHVSNNKVEINDLPQLIKQVHEILSSVKNVKNFAEKSESIVSIKKSIYPDYLISHIDGKNYKMLKRHLRKQGMTPEEYRNRFSLPHDYPMVAPNYAQHRSHLAKKIGLGKIEKIK